MIEASGLTKAYGASLALDGVDAALGPGEALALLGPNGAGKTTLLRILATGLRPTAGRATVLGYDVVREREAIRARIAVIAAASHLYGELTAAENLRFTARMRGAPAHDGEIGKVLEEVGLDGARDVRVRAFSGGMQRRLALAKVLLFHPSLVFLDEPYLALDREAGAMLDRILLAVKGRGGGAVIAAHQLGRAYAVCDRFAILVDGRVAWEGRKDGMTLAGLREAYETAVEGNRR
ncbi:MAG TPA: heme ABC exporter ATP-binding protein CcmA [Candidatus Methylomirabilis sp.]